MRRGHLLTLFFVLAALVGCVSKYVAPPSPTPWPTPVYPLLPTHTPTPTPTITPTPTPAPHTATLTPTPYIPPTSTPTMPRSPTPTPTPTPYIVVERPRVNVRTGPGLLYPILGQLLKGTTVPIIGRDPSGKWWYVCCLDGQAAWIAGWVVTAHNDTSRVSVVEHIPPPPPTPTPRPTPPPTPTPTPAPLYDRVYGPVAIPSTNPIMTVWVKVATRADTPIPGVLIRVLHNGKVLQEGVTSDVFGFTRPSPAFGFYHPYNAKLEIHNPPTGRFEIVLIQEGREVVPHVVIYRSGDTPGAEFYIAFRHR